VGRLFEYAEDSRKVKMRIGNYVAHYVVHEQSKSKPFNKSVRTPEQLNAMDRYELAKAFLESKERRYFLPDVGNSYDPEQLLQDVAKYIDQRIPKAYGKWSVACR
jgi:predicted metal-dependent hydrolase